MKDSELVESGWKWVVGLLPPDLEETAVERLALRRRRELASATDLLRLVLAYSLCDFSLRQTAAWAQVVGLAKMSDVAVLKRLRGAADWVGSLVVQCLQARALASPRASGELIIVDATVVSKPGSKGTDWRLHLGLDLARARLRSVELTGVEGGETFRRVPVEGGEVIIADRCYAHPQGVASVLDRGGHVVVRLNAASLPVMTRDGAAVDIGQAVGLLREGEIGDWPVAFRSKGVLYPMRLLTVLKAPGATAREQARIRREYTKKGKRISARVLAATGYVAILTDLSPAQAPAADVFELYRLRWQVEIAFKRLKSLVDLDRLRAKDRSLARCYLYGKLLAAILLDDLCDRLPAFSPWGFSFKQATCQSLAITQTLA